MKRKIISILLVVCMVCSLLPNSFVVTAQAEEQSGSSIDAFGITTDGDLSQEEKDAAGELNPYGTTNWMNLFPVSELYLAYGNSDGRSFTSYNYNKDGKEGSIGTVNADGTKLGGKSEGNGNGGFRFMDTAPCDPLGEGQSRYVANLAYWQDGKKVELFLTDKHGNRVSETKPFGNKDLLEYLEKVEGYNNNGLLSVACGDFNGNGKEGIVIYLPYMKEDKACVKYFDVEHNDGKFTFTGEKNLGTIYELTGTTDKTDQSRLKSSILRDVPQVQLLAEDTDKDGMDELVITTSRSNAGNVNDRGSRLSIFDYVAGETFKRSANIELGTNGASKAGRLRWASSTVGNMITNTGNAVDYPEIISAGYYDYADGDDTKISDDLEKQDNEGNLSLYMATCTGVTVDDAGNQIGNYSLTAKNVVIDASEFVRGGLYTGDDMQSLVPVQAFAARGSGYADYVLVADTVYSYEQSNATPLKQIYRHDYFNDDDDGIGASIISNGLVQDVTAGNFDGNTNGVEQVVFSTLQKRQGRNDYYSKVYTYQLKGSSWSMDSTDWLSDCIGYAYLSLTAFDCDKDGTIVKYKDVCRTYTEPEVLAILEAVPYFKEVDSGDVGNGATSYGTMNSEGESTTNSDSLTTNFIAGFEWSVDDVCAGFVCGGGFEATVEQNFTWSTEEEKYQSYSLDYANDTGDNMVIVYRRPVITYRYEEKFNGKMHTISKEGALATSMIAVEDYNEIATQRGMDTIADSVLGTPGDPFSYRNTAPTGATFKNTDKQQYNSSGTITQSFTTGTSTAESYEEEMNTSFTVYAMVLGVKGGGGAGYAATSGSSKINTSEVTKSGTVTGNNAEGYDFQWQFGHWKTDVNGNTVPVLGYVITDPTAPPSPPTNLSSEDVTSDSVTLRWDISGRPADEYYIYRDLSDKGQEPLQIATVDGTKDSCVIDNLKPNRPYTYFVRAYSAKGEGTLCYGLSVPSEELIVSTLPDDAEAPTITGPYDREAKVGGTATFAVEVVLPLVYSSVNYQWQQRVDDAPWSNVPGSTSSKTLTLTNITDEMDGTEYRCALRAATGDGDPNFYYSDVVDLKVGRVSVTADLEVTGYDEGQGTGEMATPYTGKADYPKHTSDTETKVVKDKAVTIKKTGEHPDLDVYQAYTLNGNGNEVLSNTYVGIGQVASGAVYYTIRNDTDYSVGEALELKENGYKTVSGVEYNEMPVFTDKQITKTVQETTYYLVADVTGTSSTEDSRLTAMTAKTLYWFDGANYYAYGTDGAVGEVVNSAPENVYDVYLNNGTTFVLGRGETYKNVEESNKTETAYDTGYWFYHVTEASGAYTVNCVEQENQQILSNGITLSNLKGVTKQVEETEVTPVYTTQAGQELTLQATIMDTQGDFASNATVDFCIVNTVTGATQNITGKTKAPGMVTTTWTAPAAGLYRIIATVQRMGEYAGADSSPVYYLSGATPPEKSAITEYKMELSNGSTQLDGEMTYAPDSSITIGLQSREVEETTIGTWTPCGNTIKYTVTKPDGTTVALSSSAFTPERAGLFTVKAYDGTVAVENLVASANLRVDRAIVSVAPSWDTNSVPATLSGIAPVVTSGANATVDDVFQAVCALYDSNGNSTNKAGRFTVSLAYQSNAKMVEFNNRYHVTLETKTLIIIPDSAPVYYSCGENGKLYGRYTESLYNLTNGYSVTEGTQLQFVAEPDVGYQVENWIINGDSKDKDALEGLGYTLSGNTLTIPAFDGAEQLNVEVTFVSTENKITFAYEGNGAISAVSGTGTSVESGTSVALGATVTFTATPASGRVVEKWIVDGETYTWTGTDEIYRGNTVKLENISEAHAVTVRFEEDTLYTVSTSVYGQDNADASTLATIDVVNADTGLAVDVSNPISSGTALIFTADLVDATNSTVKEWQWKKGEETEFTTIAGSGGQNSITLYDLSADMEVRAIVTSAQSFELQFSILGDDEGTATLTAKSNGNTLTAGEQPAYIPVDFTLDLDDTYYVVEWSKNVVVNDTDPTRATLDTLLSTTGEITVTVAEKPQVTVSDSANGTTTVSSKWLGEPQTIAEGDGEKKHVDKDSTITVVATPDAGYYVDSITVGTLVYNEVENNYETGAFTKTITTPVTADTTVTVVYGKKPTVTFIGDTNMTVTAKDITTSGDAVDKYSDGILFTATPAVGYEVDTWTVDNVEITETTNATNDVTTYTSPKVTADIVVHVTSKAIPQYDISYAVVNTQITTDGGDGFNGEVSLEATRKSISAYDVTGTTATNATAVTQALYRDSDVTLTATPDAGYRVKHWLVGGEVYQENGATHKGTELIFENLTEAKTAQVEFEKVTDQTSIAAINGTIVSAKVGTVNVDVDGFKLSNSATVDIVAEANEGYQLKHWTVNGIVQSETGLTFSYTSTSDTNGSHIEAVFESDSYALTYSAGANGAVTSTAGASGALVKDGTSVTFTATPDANYEVASWKVDGVTQSETSNAFTHIMTSVATVTVEFARTHYFVTFDESQLSATVNGATISSGDAVAKNSTVVYTAILEDDEIVQKWTENTTTDGGTEANPSETNTYTVSNLAADTTVSVTTMAMPSYTITYNAGDKGSVALSGSESSPATVVRHSQVILSATPDAYYQVTGWTVDGTAVTDENATALGVAITRVDGVSKLTIGDVTKNMTIAVSFAEAVRYNVKFSADTTEKLGTISATSNGETMHYTGTNGIDLIGGSKLIFTATPDDATVMVSNWTINGEVVQGNLSNTLEIDLEKSMDVVVKFEAYEGYPIPVSRGDYTITDIVRTPDDTLPIDEIRKGGTISFTVSPTSSFPYAALIICGYDCVAGTGDYSSYADKVATVKNADGSYTVTITGVKAPIDTDIQAQRLEVNNGLPANVPGTDLDTTEKIQTKLDVSLTDITEENIAYFNVELKYWNNTAGRWDIVTAENFPAEGVEVLLPYPAGTSQSNLFTIVHMFTSNHGTNVAGDTEIISNYTKTDEGLLFRVNSLSPFALGWKVPAPSGGGAGGGGGMVAPSGYEVTVINGTGDGTYEVGTWVTITAEEQEGKIFSHWTSNDVTFKDAKAATTEFEMIEKNVEVTAIYKDDFSDLRFIDVESTDWFHNYVYDVVGKGLFNGTSQTTFSPEDNTTRAMVWTVFARMADADITGGDTWYSKARTWAMEEEVSDGTFPDAFITREQFVTMLWRFEKEPTIADYEGLETFKDEKEISDYAYLAMEWARAEGIITGRNNNTLDPQGNLTRAEMAAILSRFTEEKQNLT